MQRYCSWGQRNDDKMGAEQTAKSLISEEGAIRDPPSGITLPRALPAKPGQSTGVSAPCLCIRAAFCLPELPRHRSAQRVVAFSPVQAGHYQHSPSPGISCYCSRRQTLGCCSKTVRCPAGYRRGNTLFFPSSWGIRVCRETHSHHRLYISCLKILATPLQTAFDCCDLW